MKSNSIGNKNHKDFFLNHNVLQAYSNFDTMTVTKQSEIETDIRETKADMICPIEVL